MRTLNSQKFHFAKQVKSAASPQKRGMVNELAFLLAAQAAEEGDSPHNLSVDIVDESTELAQQHVTSLRAYNRRVVTILDEDDVLEARNIAARLQYFLSRVFDGSPDYSIEVSGCGVIDTCSADVFVDGTLVEVKAGLRNYRSSDIRQILTYLALNFASKNLAISDFCIVNPRRGIFLVTSIEDACRAMSGRSEVEVLSSIVDMISSPTSRQF